MQKLFKYGILACLIASVIQVQIGHAAENGEAGARAGKRLENDLQVDPNLVVNRNLDKTIEATITVPPTDRKSFSLEFTVTIDKFYSYGKVWFGLASSTTEQNALIMFQKADDGIPRATPSVSMGPAQLTEVKNAEQLEAGTYRVVFDYSTETNSFRWQIFDSSDQRVYDSEPVKVAGRLALDQFYIKVIEQSDEGVSDVYYDGGNGVFYRSQVGHEGGIPYVIEGNLKNFSITYQ